MGERLREVAQGLPAVASLLGVQAQVVRIPEHLLEEQPRVFQPGRVLVRDVMTKKPVTIGPEADLADAVDKLLVGKFGCLPVMEEGKLVGLITETDLLRQLRTLLTKRTRPRSPLRATTKRQASSI